MPTNDERGGQRSWSRLLYQHRIQCKSLSAAWMIFISGGMKVAWGIYEQPLVKSHYSTYGEIHLTISWFLGVIIGAQIASMIVQRLSKNVAQALSGVLVAIGGILFLVYPESCSLILLARYLDGIAFGLTLLQAIVTGGEVSSRFLRGSVMSSERIFLWIGISAQLCYSATIFDKRLSLSDDQVHGAVALVLGVLAVICTLTFPIESPIYLQLNHRETESLVSMRRLQHCSPPAKDLLEMFNENKLWINDAAQQSLQGEIATTGMAFLKLAFLRSLVSLAMSLPFHWAFVLSRTGAVGLNMFLIAYGLAGLLGSLMSVCFMDCQGRRGTSLFSLCVGGTLLLAVGGIFLELQVNVSSGEMQLLSALLLAYQCINAFGFAPATTIYVSEAFAIPLKSYFIAGIIMVENLVQVLTCFLAFTVTINYATFFLTVGILNCFAGIVVIFWLPETKLLTLCECYYQFNPSKVY